MEICHNMRYKVEGRPKTHMCTEFLAPLYIHGSSLNSIKTHSVLCTVVRYPVLCHREFNYSSGEIPSSILLHKSNKLTMSCGPMNGFLKQGKKYD